MSSLEKGLLMELLPTGLTACAPLGRCGSRNGVAPEVVDEVVDAATTPCVQAFVTLDIASPFCNPHY